jgi:hypothetical protein
MQEERSLSVIMSNLGISMHKFPTLTSKALATAIFTLVEFMQLQFAGFDRHTLLTHMLFDVGSDGPMCLGWWKIRAMKTLPHTSLVILFIPRPLVLSLLVLLLFLLLFLLLNAHVLGLL